MATPVDTLLSVDEVAARLRCCRTTIFRLFARRMLRRTKIGTKTFVRESELNRLIERSTKATR